MRINPEQESILNRFQCKRVKSIDPRRLHAVTGPLIDETHRSPIIDHFRNAKHLAHEIEGSLASYVITNPEDDILLFFSIRCGELFEKVDPEKMRLGYNAWVGFNKLKNVSDLSKKEQKIALQAIEKALNFGLSYEDFQLYADKKRGYVVDVSKEPSTSVSRVSEVYSGVELKFFGINDNAKTYWASLGLPKKMGETLFWCKIVPKLEEMREVVGCQYMYLFAADKDADGHLVTYYRTVLHIDAPTRLSSNKPFFDYNSMFLYQDINELTKERDKFLNSFNPDMDDADIV